MKIDYKRHEDTIRDFLLYLNAKSDGFVLKGGTALRACYNLDRISEDIDLDGVKAGIGDIVESFCADRKYSFRIAKDTDTVKRYMVNYGIENKPLKIEVSYRRKNISDDEICTIRGINVYNINSLCLMKANAYNNRDKIRDLYDMSFIFNNFPHEISKDAKAIVRNTIEYKGLEQFDYILSTQHDPLINEDKLELEFLKMFNNAGLLKDEPKCVENFSKPKKSKEMDMEL